MLTLMISCHALTHTLAFGDDRAAAQAELDRLIPLLGRDRWGKNGKEEEPTHTIHCPTGDVTVVLEKVEVVRLLDAEADAALYHSHNETNDNKDIARNIKMRRALADAGFDVAAGSVPATR